MELTQLRYFLRVYQTRNMCAAAAQMNVSQQAVSKQIQKLEEELGVALFQRRSRGVYATPYADLLAEKVQDFMPGLDALVYDMQHKDRELTGIVRLGVQCWQMGAGQGLSYDALKEFCYAHPRVRLLWENLIPKLCVERLRDRTLDLSVTIMPLDPKGLELFPLRANRWFMLMSRAHALASRAHLLVEDLAGQRVIMASNESDTRRHIIEALRDREKPEFVDVTDFIFDLIAQQVEGEGAMMLTTEQSVGLFNPERFAMVALEGELWHTQLYLTRLEGIVHSPAERALYQHLIDKWQ